LEKTRYAGSRRGFIPLGCMSPQHCVSTRGHLLHMALAVGRMAVNTIVSGEWNIARVGRMAKIEGPLRGSSSNVRRPIIELERMDGLQLSY
jgi:hypothetical protein